MVWVVANGRLHSRPVSIGIEDKRGVVEIVNGVSDSDKVVVQTSTAGVPLTPGKRVRTALVLTAAGD